MKELTQVAEISVSYFPVKSSQPIIMNSLDAFVELFPFYPFSTIGLQEHFLVIYLNQGNKILGIYSLSKGGITGTVADIRIILATALKTAACGIILSHNHPSGNLKPSLSDIEITRKISEAGKLMDIKVRDHIIVSPERKYLSFADEGLL
jgi:DNA repair protein RadC